ncbi:hypothetical protein MAPG_03900 [Magnaporthiopsis poae ATCC 64411]|uniref:Uncharacterized protein n=1 Tax=Magnaporthiopsis poae (strain ATCC 64411 / 73-15) TaxID=644358 RepID=A0A0C4DV99_MAGP6|nr:hypothetical protein MAPG_03900 [Magnaporthiopsis poae ATCC 64411]
MTEPESFEDDLFADLYADDEPSSKPAPAAAQPAAPTPAVSAPAEAQAEPPSADGAQGGDDSMNYEEEDEDDDVDFNLGNGSVSTAQYSSERPSHTPMPSAPAPAPTARGPNSKEDGTQVQWWREPQDRYRHSGGFRGGGWFGLHVVGLVHRWPLARGGGGGTLRNAGRAT